MTIDDHLRKGIRARVNAVLEFCTCSLTSAHQVHRLRLATQRMRTVLGVTDKLLDTDFESGLDDDLRWLHKKLGSLRDLDVFMTSDQVIIKHSTVRKLQSEREKERRQTMKVIRSSRIAQLLRRLRTLRASLASRRPRKTRITSAQNERDRYLREFISKSLDIGLTKIKKSLRRHSPISNKQLHRIRKKIKNIRYTAELFAVAFPDSVTGTTLETLKAAQDYLGARHDKHFVKQLIRSKKVLAEFLTANKIKSSHRKSRKIHGRDLDSLENQFREVKNMKPFWTSASTLPDLSGLDRRALSSLNPL